MSALDLHTSASGSLEAMSPFVEVHPDMVGSKLRPYSSPHHHVTKGRYITSNDPRGYIPVYEYPLNGQWIMMDSDDGYVLWTGIWKALGNSKADIVKMLDSQPELAPLLRRVRGGYLKIQGTWMPYEVALRLSRRVAWTIREDLVPLFGPTFPSTCLTPDQIGFGQLSATGSSLRRKPRKTSNPVPAYSVRVPTAQLPARQPTNPGPIQPQRFSAHHSGDSSHTLAAPASLLSHMPFLRLVETSAQRLAPQTPRRQRYAPYDTSERRLPLPSISAMRLSSCEEDVDFRLAPMKPQQNHQLALPPISTLDNYTPLENSADVLQRLRQDDTVSILTPASLESTSQNRLSPILTSSSPRSSLPSLATGDTDSRLGSPTSPRTPVSPFSHSSFTFSTAFPKAQDSLSSGPLPVNRDWLSSSRTSHTSV